MTAQVVGSAKVTTATGISGVNFSRPAAAEGVTLQRGDIVVACFMAKYGGGSMNINTPPGFLLSGQGWAYGPQNGGATSVTIASLCYRVVDDPSNELTTYSGLGNSYSSVTYTCILFVLRDVDVTSPIRTEVINLNTAVNNTVISYSSGGVNVLNDLATVIGVINASPAIATISTFVELADSGGMAVDAKANLAAGTAVPAGSMTSSISADGRTGRTVIWKNRPANYTPNVPNAPSVLSSGSDTTPVFGVQVFDYDATQQVKARFTLYQNDGVTVIGTVDSAFATGGGLVSAEYTTALSPGTYKVDAMAIDDVAASSAKSSQTTFTILTPVNKDLSTLWNVGVPATKDLAVKWNVNTNNIVELAMLWNVLVEFAEDFTLNWRQFTPWTDITDEGPETWTEVTE